MSKQWNLIVDVARCDNCRNCFRCKCPFNIPVQRFAMYLDWRAAYGVADELEQQLRQAAVRAKRFVAPDPAGGSMARTTRPGGAR